MIRLSIFLQEFSGWCTPTVVRLFFLFVSLLPGVARLMSIVFSPKYLLLTSRVARLVGSILTPKYLRLTSIAMSAGGISARKCYPPIVPCLTTGKRKKQGVLPMSAGGISAKICYPLIVPRLSTGKRKFKTGRTSVGVHHLENSWGFSEASHLRIVTRKWYNLNLYIPGIYIYFHPIYYRPYFTL